MAETIKLPAGVQADYTTEYYDAIGRTVYETATPFVAAAEAAGVNPGHVREALQPVNRDHEVVVGEIDDIPFVSTRVRTGMPGSGRANRGGFEWMGDPQKVAKKGLIMTPKQDMMETSDEGGKGGLWVPEEHRHRITPAWRRKALITHALMHGINGYDNPTATDIGTNSEDMNVMVEALYPYLGEAAYAAVSGADEAHGGIPAFQLTTTGLGAAIILEEYLKVSHKYGSSEDPIATKLRQGERIRILQQGLGKAGAQFALNLPAEAILAGVTEYAGGIYNKDGINPQDAIRRAHANGLARGSERHDEEWVPGVKPLWRKQGDVLVPAYDQNQVDESDIRETHARLTKEIANAGATQGARMAAHEIGHAIISGMLDNGGGTLGSSKRGNMLLRRAYPSVQALKQSWNDDMHRIGNATFTEMHLRQLETGTFVSPEDVIFSRIARSAAARRDAVKRVGFVSMASAN